MIEILKKITFAQAFALLMSLLCLVFLWWISYMSFHHKSTTDIAEIKICIIGVLGSCVGYVVGSSASSRRKDDIISHSKNQSI